MSRPIRVGDDVQQLPERLERFFVGQGFGEDVRDLILRRTISHLYVILATSFGKPIDCDAMGTREMSKCWTSAFDKDLNNGLIVLCNRQLCCTRRLKVFRPIDAARILFSCNV